MSESLYGIAKIGEFDFPYCFEPETEKVTIYTGVSFAEISDGVDKFIGQKLGMVNGGYTLYKLGVPLSKELFGNEIRYINYLIEDYKENSQYTEIRFQFTELDYFMPSNTIFHHNENQFIFSRAIDTICNFNIKYRGFDVSVLFDKKSISNVNVKAKTETVSEVVLKFSETDDLNFLVGLYLATRTFFTFIFNRQNIGLRSAVIIGKYPGSTIIDEKIVNIDCDSKQKLVLSQKYLESVEDKKVVSNVPRISLFLPKIKELFQLFFEKDVGEDVLVNTSSIHPSVKYKNLIDLKQSLHITAAFEYYVRTQLPEISSKDTIDFYDDIKNLLDEYIKNNSSTKKKKAKDLKKSLQPQLSLKEKILKAYNGYSTDDFSTWEPLEPILSDWFGKDVEELANIANLWRNELAHEKREYEPDERVINAIRLIEHINYCVVLRCAGYDNMQIKKIISKILAKPI